MNCNCIKKNQKETNLSVLPLCRFATSCGPARLRMRPFVEKQLLHTLKLWDQRESGLWRANPRHLLSSVLSSAQGIRLLKDEKLELNKTLQLLIRHKRLLDWVNQDHVSDDGCQWSRLLKALQSSKWKELRSPGTTKSEFLTDSVGPMPVFFISRYALQQDCCTFRAKSLSRIL